MCTPKGLIVPRSASFLWLFLCPLTLAAQTSAILEGDVTDAATNAPIATARLRLDDLSGESIYTKADRNGHFAFAGLAPGRYQLAVESPGYRT